jgi:hypothetical protein
VTRFRRRDAQRRDDLVLLAAGMLEERERAELLAHLETGCPECTADLAAGGATFEKLATVLRPDPPPERVKAALMARVAAEPREATDGGADAEQTRRPSHSQRDEELLARALAAARAAGEGDMRRTQSPYDDELLARAIAAARGAQMHGPQRSPLVLPLLTAIAAAVVAAGMTWFGMRNEYGRVIGRLEDDVSRLRVASRLASTTGPAAGIEAGKPERAAAPPDVVAPTPRAQVPPRAVEPAPPEPAVVEATRPPSERQATTDLAEPTRPSHAAEAAAGVHDLESQLAAAHRAVTAADLRAEKAERELAALGDEQARLSATNAGLVGELAALKAEAESLRKTNADLQDRVASLEHAAATKTSDGARERQQLRDRIDVLQAKLNQAGEATAMLSSPAVEVATLDAAKAAPEGATASVFWDYERNTCYLRATGLAPTKGEEVYALWLETDADRTYPMGSFRVRANGEGTLLAMLPAGNESIERATVTLEPAAPETAAAGPAVLDARFGKSSSGAGSRRRRFYRGR